ncbi:MAG: cell wall-binding repeat-containing protein [Microcella sp.]|uniref:cell wall-binding repeat-containing protein n=1 Tax=Microcella sp. TaxID=1913979 RepID=UPI0033163916
MRTRLARSLAMVSALAVAAVTFASPATAASFDEPGSSPAQDGGEQRSAQALGAADTGLSPTAIGTLQGRLLVTPTGGGSAIPVADGGMYFYETSNPTELVDIARTDVDGYWSITGLPVGTYEIAAFSDDAEWPVKEWVANERFRINADIFTFADDATFTFPTYTLGERTFDVTREFGADRFATAVALSQSRFTAGSGPKVFIVNGRNFPDALSAGALAAVEEGVLLLVEQNSVPTIVQGELSRLSPQSITIVGGTAVVSNSVKSVLENYLPGDPVLRIAGANRYETSRTVITAAPGFDGDVDALFIATGTNFPDALASVPAATKVNAGLLLVDGSASRLDTATRNLVDTLNVPVYVIGGTGVVSSGIFSQLQGLAPDVLRVAGADRFATSVEVAFEFFENSDYAYLANGFNFPDALAAGPIAGDQNSPLYLIRRDCVPEVVFEDVLDVLANGIINVGGTAAISEQGASGQVCS